ncbi:MAG: hypothetical protein KDC87_17405 [Planctomycetes bacterium]|nr:hypothetical protein [Planctomycetota bacterium]MCB9870541.1 hypothetical protein [Planctomycetota bacterium]MCB9889709.1 hypothetical protein [Planctomycetota bacterium]
MITLRTATKILSVVALATSVLVPKSAPVVRTGLDAAYAKEIHKQLDYFAAWDPTNKFSLGDFGQMEGKVFKRLGNVKKFGIQFTTEKFASGPITYTSSGNTNVNVDVGAKDKNGKNQVDVKVTFSKTKSILLQVEGVTTERIKNIGKFGDALVDLYKAKGKDWKLSYVVITEVKRSKGGCVLISKEADSKVTLSGKAEIKKSGAKLADVDLRDFSVGVTKGKVYGQPWNSECTPLFQLHEVKDPITKKAYFTEYK